MRNRRRNCSCCCESRCCPPTNCSHNAINMPVQEINPASFFSSFDPRTDRSYASFWNTCPAEIETGEDFEFNQAGICTPDIMLVSPRTIKICTAGIYKISYRVNISVEGVADSTELINHKVSLYVNCLQQPNSQAGFSMQTPSVTSCIPLNGDALVFLPANACLNLVNESQCVSGSTIKTCTSGGNTVSLYLFRVN